MVTNIVNPTISVGEHNNLANLVLLETYSIKLLHFFVFFFSSRRRHTRCSRDWSSDVCSSDLPGDRLAERLTFEVPERDVDRRDGGDRPALSPVVAERGVQVLPEHGVLECVLSDEARGVDLVDERPVDRRRAVRLTESGEAVLGEDLDDERLTDGVPAFRGAEHLGLGQLVAKDPGADFADLHGRLRRLP